mmetsp:Transcript_25908/g.75940  ORF Transcript_25908/g.75940 Transcript_25908/m.75940 type:complete len:142 (+) Transcript_25908:340-765(+)
MQAGPYVPRKSIQAAVKATRVAQVGALAAYFMGDALLQRWPRGLSLIASARENRFPCAIALYISHLACELAYSTSAFEVTYNGQVLFSKLKEGRYPQPGEISSQLRILVARKEDTASKPVPQLVAPTDEDRGEMDVAKDEV